MRSKVDALGDLDVAGLDERYGTVRGKVRLPARRADGSASRLVATASGQWLDTEDDVTLLLDLNRRLRSALTDPTVDCRYPAVRSSIKQLEEDHQQLLRMRQQNRVDKQECI